VLDIIEPLGAKYQNPTVLLRAHDHQSPIGSVTFDRPTKTGVGFLAKIPKIQEPGLLKDRVDMAWGEIKHGLVRAVSIGFRPTVDPEPLKTGGLRFPKIEIYELSTVAVPAQALATIDQIKAIDAAVRAGETPATASATSALEAMLRTAHDTADSKAMRDLLMSEGQRCIDESFAVKETRDFQLGHAAAGLAAVVGRHLADFVIAVEQRTIARIADVERRLEEQGRAYKGIWKPGTYAAGSFVTHSGSMWHADKATDFKPGEGGGWTLAVKRGGESKERGQ
jgi:hypothetical protein